MSQRARATEAVDILAERDADDDAYLAELRKAMTDEVAVSVRARKATSIRSSRRRREPSRSRFGRRR